MYIFWKALSFIQLTGIHVRRCIPWGHWVIKNMSQGTSYVRINVTRCRYVWCLLYLIFIALHWQSEAGIHPFSRKHNIYKSKTGMNMLHMNKNINDPFHWMVIITQYMQVSGLCYWSSAQLSRIVMVVSRHMATSMMFTNRWCLSIVNWWIISSENRLVRK